MPITQNNGINTTYLFGSVWGTVAQEVWFHRAGMVYRLFSLAMVTVKTGNQLVCDADLHLHTINKRPSQMTVKHTLTTYDFQRATGYILTCDNVSTPFIWLVIPAIC